MSAEHKTVAERIAELEGDISTCYELIAVIDEAIAESGDDPSLLKQKADAISEVADFHQQLAALRQAPPKVDSVKSNHATAAKDADIPPPPSSTDDAAQVFNVKDSVMAKWSQNREFFAATIISKTGSSSDPVYTVKFQIDGTKETKRKHEVRAMPNGNGNGKKRKAEGIPAAVSTPPAAIAPPSTTRAGVISGPAVIDTSLLQKPQPSMVSDGPTRSKPAQKKLKGNKQLESKQSAWQMHQQNGPKKAVGGAKPKESMFRTPDAPSARVGVIGSGKGMQKDESKARWGGGGSHGRDAKG